VHTVEQGICRVIDAIEPFPVLGSLIEHMPGGRVRLNPAAVSEVSCLILAISQRWEDVLRKTHRGMTSEQRAALRDQKSHARRCLRTVGEVLTALTQTTSRRDYATAFHGWFSIPVQSIADSRTTLPVIDCDECSDGGK
jgi:hypothetical protein